MRSLHPCPAFAGLVKVGLLLAWASAPAAFAQALPNPMPPGPDEALVTPDEGETNKTYYRRHLAVSNRAAERITVFLQYRSFDFQTRKWEWLPAAPATGQALAFEIEPGQTLPLETVDKKVAGSMVRLWAASDNLVWENQRDVDFWLVPLSDAGKREYQAATVETFTYEFLGPQVPGEAEAPLPPNTAAEFGRSPIAPIIGPDLPDAPPDAGQPLFQGVPEALPEFVVVPDTLVQAVPFPEPPPPPLVPIVAEADLAVAALEVQLNGSFRGRIRNHGPSTYTGGRRWYLFRATGGGPFAAVANGTVPGLRSGGSLLVSGNLPRLTQAAKFVLQLTAGDTQPANDQVGQSVVPPVRADLALGNVRLANGVVSVDVVNNGPGDYTGFFRRVSVVDRRNLLIPFPETKPIGPLPAGAATTLQFPALALDPGPRNYLIATLIPGDREVSNDTATLPLSGGGGGPTARRDYAAGVPALAGSAVQATITADAGAQPFLPARYTLSWRTLERFPATGQAMGTIQAQPGAPQTVQAVLRGVDPAAKSIVATLTIEGDANPANNQASARFGRQTTGTVSDLGFVQNRVTVIGLAASLGVRNFGPDPYSGKRLIQVTDRRGQPVGPAVSVVAPGVALPPFGQPIDVAFGLPPGTPFGSYTARFVQTTPDGVADPNTINDAIEFRVGPTSGPIPGPITGNRTVDLGFVPNGVTVIGRAVQIKVRNNSTNSYRGTRMVAISGPPGSAFSLPAAVPVVSFGNSLRGGETVDLAFTMPFGARGTFQASFVQTTPDGYVDPVFGNDSTTFTVGTGGGGMPLPVPGGGSVSDLEFVPNGVTVIGNAVTLQVRNNGPNVYRGTRLVAVSGPPGSSVPMPSTSVLPRGGSLAVGATIPVRFSMPNGARGAFRAGFAQTTPDGVTDPNPANDSVQFTVGGGGSMPVPGGGSVSDLEFVPNGVTVIGNAVTLQVRNNGPDVYRGTRLVSVSGPGGVNLSPSVLPRGGSLAVGATIPVRFSMPNGARGAFRAGFAQTTPDGVTDPNPANDSTTFTVGGGMPNPNPGGSPLRLSDLRYDPQSGMLRVNVFNNSLANLQSGADEIAFFVRNAPINLPTMPGKPSPNVPKTTAVQFDLQNVKFIVDRVPKGGSVSFDAVLKSTGQKLSFTFTQTGTPGPMPMPNPGQSGLQVTKTELLVRNGQATVRVTVRGSGGQPSAPAGAGVRIALRQRPTEILGQKDAPNLSASSAGLTLDFPIPPGVRIRSASEVTATTYP